ncbi:MAG: fasciclin domain-containing protein [Pseudomonadota bacterium]
MKILIDAATQAGKTSALLSAFKSASFIDLLRSPGHNTINLPSDDAFKRLSSGSLDALFKNARTLKPFMSSQMMTGTAAANDGLAS